MSESRPSGAPDRINSMESQPARRSLFPGLQLVSACLHPLKQAVSVAVSKVYERFNASPWPIRAAPNNAQIVVKVRTEIGHLNVEEQPEKLRQSFFLTKVVSFIDQCTPNSIKRLVIYSRAVFSAQTKNICKITRISEIWRVCTEQGWWLSTALKKVNINHRRTSIVATWLLPSMLDAAEMFNYAVDYLKVHDFPLNAYIPMIPVEQIELAFEGEDSWPDADSSGNQQHLGEGIQNSETNG